MAPGDHRLTRLGSAQQWAGLASSQLMQGKCRNFACAPGTYVGSELRAIMRDEKRVWRNPQETIISHAYLLPMSGMPKKGRKDADEKHSHVARHRNRRARPLQQQAINLPGRSSFVDDEILHSQLPLVVTACHTCELLVLHEQTE